VFTNLNKHSTAVFDKMLTDAVTVNPDARPVVIALIETPMDNNVSQESWGPLFFPLW
jgi:hypothetical protein